MLIDYISSLKNFKSLCDDFEKRVTKRCFKGGQAQEATSPFYCWSPQYLIDFVKIKAFIELCKLLKPKALQQFHQTLLQAELSLTNPKETNRLKDFKRRLKVVRLSFDLVKDEIVTFCSAFDDEEQERVNEAIHNYLEGCYLSCVAMSVSAVESRLLKLMSIVSPESKRTLERKTLGGLIGEYTKNRDKYNDVVPEKHEPLLDLCNTYRIFSVHPKKQRIPATVATSIFNLAMAFLMDQDAQPKVVEIKWMLQGKANKPKS